MTPKIAFATLVCGTLLLCAAGGCAHPTPAPEEPEIPEKSNALRPEGSKNPITQVRQTLNLKPQDTFQATMGSIQRRGIAIASAHEEDGLLETDWLNVTDTVCGAHRIQGAPLPCRVRMSVKIEPVSIAASALNVRYEELCALNEEIPTQCPGSAAEKLMLGVVEDVRQIDAQSAPKK